MKAELDHRKPSSSPEKARELLRGWLVESTGYDVQHDGWPCGTCFMSLLDSLGLDETHALYKERNLQPDRHNEVWRAIVQIREANLAQPAEDDGIAK